MNTIAKISVKISPSRRYYHVTILRRAMFDIFNELVITFWFSETTKTIIVRFLATLTLISLQHVFFRKIGIQ
jgi:hypothetical protein